MQQSHVWIQQHPTYEKRGKVTLLYEREGIITDWRGYRFRFETKNADANVKQGSPVTFRIVYPENH